MATSGTVSTTQFNTRRVIDTAARRARISPELLAGENLQTAQAALYLLLSNEANVGTPLWCQEKVILPLYTGVSSLVMPIGTEDILNANLRQLQRLTGTASSSSGTADNAFDGDIDTVCTEVAVAGNITLTLDSEAFMTNFGLLAGATGTWSITLQYSLDGVTFTTFYTNTTLAVVNGEWIWLDFQGVPEAIAYRLVAGAATTLVVRELVFANTPSEIPMARINRDDYMNLPNKSFQGRPVQYWFNRQMQPVMELWPAPQLQYTFYQAVLERKRQIQDVGTLRESIEVPQRWFDYICWELACKLVLEIPEANLEVLTIIQPERDEAQVLVWGEERDNSPAYLQPNLSYYTA